MPTLASTAIILTAAITWFVSLTTFHLFLFLTFPSRGQRLLWVGQRVNTAGFAGPALSLVCVGVCAGARAQPLNPVPHFVTPWTVAHQIPLSMEFSRQEYWRRFAFPSTGDLSDPGFESHLLHWQVDSLPLSHLGSLAVSLTTTQLYHYNVKNSHRQCVINEQNSTKSLVLDTKFEFHIVFLSHELLFLWCFLFNDLIQKHFLVNRPYKNRQWARLICGLELTNSYSIVYLTKATRC